MVTIATIRPGRFDLEIKKKAKFYLAFELTLDDEVTASNLTNKSVYCVIKESKESEKILFELTEANGGIERLGGSRFALYIAAPDTDIEPDNGFYNIWVINNLDPVNDRERFLEGKVLFTDAV